MARIGGASLPLISSSVAIFKAPEMSCARERAFWILERRGLGKLVGERRAVHHPNPVSYHPCSPGGLAKAAGSGRASSTVSWARFLSPIAKTSKKYTRLTPLTGSSMHWSIRHNLQIVEWEKSKDEKAKGKKSFGPGSNQRPHGINGLQLQPCTLPTELPKVFRNLSNLMLYS